MVVLSMPVIMGWFRGGIHGHEDAFSGGENKVSPRLAKMPADRFSSSLTMANFIEQLLFGA